MAEVENKEQAIEDQVEEIEADENSEEAEELKKLEQELGDAIPADDAAVDEKTTEKPLNAAIKVKIERLRELRRRKKEKKREKKLMDKPEDPYLQNVLKEIELSFDGKEFEALMKVVQPTVRELKKAYFEITEDIRTALTRYYPQVDIKVFGSCVTDLIFHKSDFDFYIDVPGNEDDLSKLNRVHRLIANSKRFERPIKISRARTPLIKVTHKHQKVHVDINVSNPMGVFNSEFLRWALQFDPRIKPLALFIKYWARVHHLAGTNLISNYCLTMLVLFYLMNLPAPVFPPIQLLQQRIQEYYVGPWNMAFDAQFMNTTSNMMTVVELLEGFFQFYSNFAFEESVISPFAARYYPRKAFEENHAHIFEAERYYSIQRRFNVQPLTLATPICVQDPFEMNVNIGNSVNGHTLSRFRSYAQLAVELFRDFPVSTCRASIILKKLLTNHPVQKPPISLLDLVSVPIGKQVCKLQPMQHELLAYNKITQKEGTEPTGNKAKRLWTEKTIEFLERMFKEIFLIRLFPFETPRYQRGHYILGDYQIRLRANTWENREKIEFTDQTGLDREIAKSNELKETNPPIVLDAEITFKTSRERDAIEIEIDELSGKEENKKLLKAFFEGTIQENARSCIKSFASLVCGEQAQNEAETEAKTEAITEAVTEAITEAVTEAVTENETNGKTDANTETVVEASN